MRLIDNLTEKSRFVNNVSDLISAVNDNVPHIAILAGSYSLGSTLTLASSTNLQGLGKVTINATAGLTGSIITISGTNSINISNIEFDTSLNSSAEHITISGTTNKITIEGCIFTGGNGTSLYYTQSGTSNDIRVINCKFNSSTSSSDAVLFNGTITNVLISGCVFNSVAAGTSSINLTSASKVNISNCFFTTSSGTSIESTGTASEITISNCHFTSVTDIANLSSNVALTSCIMDSCGAVTVTGTAGINVANCVFTEGTGNSITLSGSGGSKINSSRFEVTSSTTQLNISNEANVTENVISGGTTGISTSGSFNGTIGYNFLTGITTPLSIGSTAGNVKKNHIDTHVLTPASASSATGTLELFSGTDNSVNILGLGTLFTTELAVGDIVVPADGNRQVVGVIRTNTLLTSIGRTTHTDGVSFTIADRVTAQPYRNHIQIDGQTNSQTIDIPDLTEESAGHILKVSANGTSLIYIVPTTYDNGLFRDLDGLRSHEMIWTGKAWRDLALRPTVSELEFNGDFSSQSFTGTHTLFYDDQTVSQSSGGAGFPDQSSGADLTGLDAQFTGLYQLTVSSHTALYTGNRLFNIAFNITGYGRAFNNHSFRNSFGSMNSQGVVHIASSTTVDGFVENESGTSTGRGTSTSVPDKLTIRYLGARADSEA